MKAYKNRKITPAGYIKKKETKFFFYILKEKKKKKKKKFFENLNLSIVVDNKKFRKVVKPLFNEKGSGISNEVVMFEKDKTLRDEKEMAKEFHSYFNSIVSSIGITENIYTIQKNSFAERIDKVIMKFQFHPSIQLIKIKINK